MADPHRAYRRPARDAAFALVLAGARVGAGCVVDAGSIVTGETPNGCVVAGVPVRKMRSRPSSAQH